MTLDEILAEINEKYPNSFANDSKVRKINNIQNKLFRTVVKRTVTHSIDIINGISEYTLSFSPAKIREVLVNGVRYDYKQIEEDASTRFFYIEDNNLGIYPTPTEDQTSGIMIFRYQEPSLLSANSLSAIPDFDPDYHSVLIYGVCKELAEVDARYDVANGFMAQYTNELDQYEIANQDTEPAQIQEEARW